MSTAPGDWPTTEELLEAPLAGGEVIGGPGGLDRPVRGVVLWDHPDPDTYRAGPDDVVVLVPSARSGQWSPATDVLVRRAAASGAAMTVLGGEPVPLPLSTGRLADRLGHLVVQAPAGTGPVDLAVRLRMAVDGPVREDADLLAAAADRLSEARELSEVVLVLETLLAAEAAILLGERGVVAGRADLVSRPRPAEGVCRIERAIGEEPGRMIVLARPSASRRWQASAERIAALAAVAAAGIDSRQRLAEARHRHVVERLMTEILAGPDTVPGVMAAQAARLGLALDGWHIGIDVAIRGSAPPGAVLDLVRQRVREDGTMTPWLRRGGGFVGWHSVADAPTATMHRRLTARLESAVADCGRRWPGTHVVIGVGAAGRDASGIARSVDQAGQAGLVAASSPEGAVQVVQDLGASRLLLGWYGSGVFRDVAEDILAPLLALGDPEIVRTLAAYLDRACSASHTARALQVHRNTVNQRIARAEKALGVTLTDADARLALQLALRAHRQTED